MAPKFPLPACGERVRVRGQGVEANADIYDDMRWKTSVLITQPLTLSPFRFAHGRGNWQPTPIKYDPTLQTT